VGIVRFRKVLGSRVEVEVEAGEPVEAVVEKH
jgi:hypothetical protein